MATIMVDVPEGAYPLPVAMIELQGKIQNDAEGCAGAVDPCYSAPPGGLDADGGNDAGTDGASATCDDDPTSATQSGLVRDVRAGQVVGRLSKDSMGAYVLTIGRHRLRGKVAPLKKPLVVLKKGRPGQRGSPANPELDPWTRSPADRPSGDTDSTDSQAQGVAYSVVAILKEKLVFAARPEPVVTASYLGKATLK
ncbi:hypothetical protein H696_05032 [Fonticula alba]|uniref:Chromosome transmission fidelity protein 8 n=1 Tax=Fonticula alba TaxID=691883 RepID=A0A058Z3M7_FONAL|nr:hypothetical protein H696_05032 [Fonticula alba]KCV68746.1 hypothetical protein H696_05032 [Fonticula alba]|eukprot:XP_009497178.1 hypothetical protein H696_05032 [Fonticula alba]